MATIIQNIITVDNKREWNGYKFIMSDPTKNIICKISNIANCCEKFGIYTKSNLSDFIGAEYQSVTVSTRPPSDKYDSTHIVEVAVQTDRGEILIQLYNEHNGYYPHDFFTQSEHGTKIERL